MTSFASKKLDKFTNRKETSEIKKKTKTTKKYMSLISDFCFKGLTWGWRWQIKGRGEERVKEEEGRKTGGGMFSRSSLPDYLELDDTCLKWVS